MYDPKIYTITSFKGGVCKTTTAIHLAAYLATRGSTLLLDGDETRIATLWSERGRPFPFRVAPIEHGVKISHHFEFVVVDCGQKPRATDFRASAEGSDLVIVPTVPSRPDTDALVQTIGALQEIADVKFRVLIARVPNYSKRRVDEVRKGLAGVAPVLRTVIPRLDAFEKAAEAGDIVRDTRDPRAAEAWAAYAAAGKELFG